MKYEIYEQNLQTLTEKLNRLNIKLTRIGAAPVAYKVTGHRDVPSSEDAAKLIRVIELDVEGVAPKANGWTFLATLVHTDDGNIIRSVPGFVAPVDYRDKAPLCDHCHAHRVRRDTFIVRHEDGRTMQVGSSCLEDFIGVSPDQATKAAEHLFNAFDICEAATRRGWLGGSSALTTYRIDLDTYLKHVAAVVLKDGCYITRKMATEQYAATSSVALSLMDGSCLQDRYPITPEAETLATTARQWVIKTFSPALADPDAMSDDAIRDMVIGSFKAANKTLSDFEHNMLSCARAEAIEPRLCGISAYIVEAYRRSLPKPALAQLNVNGLGRIFKMFTSAVSTLKRPAIRLADAAGTRLHLSLAGAASKNAGYIYVKSGDNYYGKISPEGLFFPTAACPSTVEPHLKAFAENPEAVAAQYGSLTGDCCFCGRKLTDDRSTHVGYGPVCADKFGLSWGKTSEFLAGHRAALEAQATAVPIQHLKLDTVAA